MVEDRMLNVKWKVNDVIIVFALYLGLSLIVIIFIFAPLFYLLTKDIVNSYASITSQELKNIFNNYWYLYGVLNIIGQLALIILPIMWIMKKKYGTLSSLGLKTHDWVKNFLIGFAFGLGYRIIVSFPAIMWTLVGKPMYANPAQADFYLNWLMVPSDVIIGPIGESIFITGFTFPAFAKKFGIKIGAVISAIIFVVCHFTSLVQVQINIFSILPFFLIELIVIWLYLKRKSLFSPIGFHMAYNFLFLIILFFNTSKLSANDPTATIQHLFEYSQKGEWSSVERLMSSNYLSECDQKELRDLFIGDSIKDIEPILLEQDSLCAIVLLKLIAPDIKKIGDYPILLIFQDGEWRILCMDSLSPALRRENYVPSDEARMYYILGCNYVQLKHYDQAIHAFKKSIDFDPDIAVTYWGLGTMYIDQGEYEEAIIVLKQAIDIDSSLASVHYNLGIAYYYLGHIDESIRSHKQAINLEPDFVEVYIWLARIFEELGDFEKAFENIDQAVFLKSDDPMMYSTRGYIYSDGQKYNEAIRDFNEAIELDKQYKDAYVGLAITYYQMGNKREAKENYKHAIEFDGRYSDIGRLKELTGEGIIYSESHVQVIKEILKEMGYYEK